MRSGKDWGKTMEPLFPRLHLKDNEKGGPKTPSRNKMAVYEELLITPSTRFCHGSAALMPLQQNGSVEMAPLVSTVHGVDPQKKMVSSLFGPPALAHATSREILNKLAATSAPRSAGYTTSSMSENTLATSRSSSFQTSNFFHFEAPSSKEDELKVTDPSLQSQKVPGENRLKRANFCDLDQEGHAKNSAANPQSPCRDSHGPNKRLASASTVRAGVLSNESSKLLLCNGNLESSKNAPVFSSNNVSNADENKDDALEDSSTEQPKVSGNNTVSLLRADSCAESLISDNNVVPAEDASGTTEITSVTIFPDDILQIIGEENFWKARRILINQQSIFSFQVSELHRLVQVQKSFSHCQYFHQVNKEELPPPPLPPPPLPPQPLLPPTRPPPPPLSAPEQPNHSLMNVPLLCDPMKNDYLFATSSSPLPPLPPLPSIKSIDLCLKTTVSPLGYNSNKTSVSTPPPLNKPDESSPKTGAPIGNSPGKALPTSFYPPLENQWLVPVLSSEGLVYKPYTGPNPLNSSFLNVVHGIPVALSHPDPKSRSHSDPESSDLDRQGSTGSSSVERAFQDALPLFPLEPAAATKFPSIENNEIQTQAIKAVPHGRKLAVESAMKIFQSIQEERRQNELAVVAKLKA